MTASGFADIVTAVALGACLPLLYLLLRLACVLRLTVALDQVVHVQRLLGGRRREVAAAREAPATELRSIPLPRWMVSWMVGGEGWVD